MASIADFEPSMRLILEHDVALLLEGSGRLDTNSVTPSFLMSLSPTFRHSSARELGTPSRRPSKQCGSPACRHGSCAVRDCQNGVLSGSRTLSGRRFRATKVLTFLSEQPRCVVVTEACVSAHHWGRAIRDVGHAVRLFPPV
jgi:hypothetical protein